MTRVCVARGVLTRRGPVAEVPVERQGVSVLVARGVSGEADGDSRITAHRISGCASDRRTAARRVEDPAHVALTVSRGGSDVDVHEIAGVGVAEARRGRLVV